MRTKKKKNEKKKKKNGSGIIVVVLLFLLLQSFECEQAAFAECVRLLKERQGKDDQLPGPVIFCDCRSLVQNLGGFNPINMGYILSVTEQLRQAGARITCQWVHSHVGIHGNEVAEELDNGGRLKPQPVVPATLAHVASLLRGRTAKQWEETIRSCDDTRLVKYLKPLFLKNREYFHPIHNIYHLPLSYSLILSSSSASFHLHPSYLHHLNHFYKLYLCLFIFVFFIIKILHY